MDVKSVIAVLGGIVIVFFLGDILEGPLVGKLAAKAPTSMEELMAARNEPNVLLGRLVITALVSVLAGYMVAKIAGQYEWQHALVAAAMQGYILLRGFAADPGAANVSSGMRVTFVAATAAAMLAGALIRARASRLAPPTEVES